MDCIVLAGGLGTRLRPAVADRPKPLALIKGIPFLALLMDSLAPSGLVRKVVMALGYKAEAIIEFCSTYSFSIPIEFSQEDHPLGTGGAVKKALAKTDSDHVLVLNGDSYLDFSLEKLLKQHLQEGFEATLVYTQVVDTSRFGRLEIEGNRIKSFQEKTDSREPGFINAGIYVFNRSVFDKLSFPETFSLESDLFPLLVPRGMGAFRAEGTFIDIGTPDSYREAQTILQPLVQSL